jgi:hypothetical protein
VPSRPAITPSATRRRSSTELKHELLHSRIRIIFNTYSFVFVSFDVVFAVSEQSAHCLSTQHCPNGHRRMSSIEQLFELTGNSQINRLFR